MARDYRREYQRRLASGVARGLTPSQARGHPKRGETLASVKTGGKVQGAARRGAEARMAREYGVLDRIGQAVREALAPPAQWRAPTPGGTRDLVTSDPAVVMAALREAAAAGREALVNVIGSGGGRKGGGRRGGQRSTGRQRAERLVRSLEDADDLGEAIADMDGDQYAPGFTSYGVYEVKMFA